MRKLLYITICLIATLSMLWSCKSDSEVDIYVTTDKSSIEVTKKGIDYKGGEVTLQVSSNTYWKITYDEEYVEWIKISPRAGFGDATVVITVPQNTGEARAATLTFETKDNSVLEIPIRQAGYNEMLSYYVESCGMELEEETPVVRYDGWKKDGYGSEMVTYSGDATVTNVNPSKDYEGASGDNSILLREVGQAVIINNIRTNSDPYFNFSMGFFGATSPSVPSPIALEASNDGENWFPFECDLTGSSSWKKTSINFKVYDLDNLFLRVRALAANVQIDDISIEERNAEDCQYELVITQGGDDNHSIGFEYFKDDFSWVTYQFGGTDYLANPSLNTDETRFDLVYMLPQEQIDIFESKGWKQNNNSEPCYLRLGYLKIGKSQTRGTLTSPSMTGIREGKVVNAKLTFDAVQYMSSGGTKDKNGLRVEVTGGATINSATKTEVDVMPFNYENWPNEPISMNIYNMTSETKIIFKSTYTTAYLTSNAVSNRFFLRNVSVTKIGKDTPQTEDWMHPLSAPYLDQSRISASGNSLALTWDAVPNAGRYSYVITDESGATVADGITTECACAASKLKLNKMYSVKVKSLSSAEVIYYTDSEWSNTISIATQDKDPHPVGYVFFEDDLSWLTADFSPNTSGWADGWVDVRCTDLQTTLPADKYAIYLSKGYEMTDRAYINMGALKLGRAYNSGAHLGTITLPKSSVADIPDEAIISVNITFSAAMNQTGDTHVVHVRSSAGQDLKFELTSTVTKEWKDYTLRFDNVSKDTTFTLYNKTEVSGKANRVYFNHFTIKKASTE